MVIIWNDLACGDREAAAVLVALNSIFQVVMFAVLGWFYLSVLPGWLGLQQTTSAPRPGRSPRSVIIFLGIPLLAGYLSRRLGERAKGRDWYEQTFLPRVGPWALYGLLFTIVILFALQGNQIISRPLDVARIALPLLAYFAVMWVGGYLLGAALIWATHGPPPWPSPRPATTSSSPSPLPSPPTEPRLGRHSPAWSVPSSRYQSSLRWSMSRWHCAAGSVSTTPPPWQGHSGRGIPEHPEPEDGASRTPTTAFSASPGSPLGTTAYKQGRAAGENAVGGNARYAGSLGTQVVKVFDLVAARTGLREYEAHAANRGWTPATTASTPDDHKAYYPGATPINIRVTGDEPSGLLLGAQLVGHRSAEVAKRVDTYATALFHNMTIDAVNDLDLSYTPPLGSPWDAVQLATQTWVREHWHPAHKHARTA